MNPATKTRRGSRGSNAPGSGAYTCGLLASGSKPAGRRSTKCSGTVPDPGERAPHHFIRERASSTPGSRLAFGSMSLLHAVAIFVAGIAAGTINTVVGSGTLITFPALLAFGYAPVTANVSNTIGLVPGSVSGGVGYRRELSGQRDRTLPLALASALGGTAGAILLLTLPASAFKAIVPAFIVIAL